MPGLRVRAAIVIGVLALAAAFSAVALYPEKMERGADQAAALPLLLDSWAGQEVPVSEEVKIILETDDVIQRNYTSPLYLDIPVMLAVVFSPDNRRVAHPPEVCYTGSGWESNAKEIVNPQGLPPMVRLVMSKGRRHDIVYYCYKAGDEMTANYYQQQWNIIRNQMRRRATSSALIRFSTVSEPDANQAEARLLEFMRKMMPVIQKTLE